MSQSLQWFVAQLLFPLALFTSVGSLLAPTSARAEPGAESAPPSASQTGTEPVPLHVAVKKGLVRVEVAGRGASTGDSVEVRVRRTQNADIAVSVAPGTVITPQGDSVQSMALSSVKYKVARRALQPASVMELNDNQEQTYILEAYCRDLEKPTPTRQSSFEVTGPDEANARLLDCAKRHGATVKVTQSAIWIQRGNPTDEQLRRQFPVNDEEIGAARALLLAINQPEETVDINLQGTFERLRGLAAQWQAKPVRRGDVVEVVAAETPLVARGGETPIATLRKGTQAFVVASWENEALIRAQIDGKTTRGSVKIADVAVVKPATYPVLRALREATESVSVEVFDKVDVQINLDR